LGKESSIVKKEVQFELLKGAATRKAYEGQPLGEGKRTESTENKQGRNEKVNRWGEGKVYI